MAPAHNRREAANRFWSDVEELLEREHGHPVPDARQGIERYKGAVEKGGRIPEAVYNQGEEQAAKVIDAVIRCGLPTPAPA